MTGNEKILLGLVLEIMNNLLSLAESHQALQKTVCLLIPGEEELKRALLDEIARNESKQDSLRAHVHELRKLLSGQPGGLENF
jgi:hypothetical protein